MKNTIKLLLAGFESSSGVTKEFLNFVRTFKREFTKELKSIGATDIMIGRGHFNVTGFFKSATGQPYYFSLSDVRDLEYSLIYYPDTVQSQLMYRTAKDYKDFTGGGNQWISIDAGMANEMNIV